MLNHNFSDMVGSFLASVDIYSNNWPTLNKTEKKTNQHWVMPHFVISFLDSTTYME